MIEHNIRWKGTNSLDIPGKIIECKSATEARFHPLRDQSLLPWIPSDIYACHGKKGHVALEQSGFVRCKSLLDPVQVTKRGGGLGGGGIKRGISARQIRAGWKSWDTADAFDPTFHFEIDFEDVSRPGIHPFPSTTEFDRFTTLEFELCRVWRANLLVGDSRHWMLHSTWFQS